MLDAIRGPEDLKNLSAAGLEGLAAEIRAFLISSISKTGGHIGANLGVVELTIAVHYVFDAPRDTIIFDVGHQGYTHKLLTGRKALFPTLNMPGGMSRFISRRESPFDEIEASHAGTAISIGTGIAHARRMEGAAGVVVAIVGDGAAVEGMSFEGLNFAAEHTIPLVIVVNDNGMSIPRNVGGINNLFEGEGWQERSQGFFEGLGFRYFPVADGHSFHGLIGALTEARKQGGQGPVVVHVKTEKGRGLALAKDHPYKMHFSMPFDPLTGEGCSPVPQGASYAAAAGEVLYRHLQEDPKVVVLSPATPYASGIERCLAEFPDRAFDVGMAEQHCLGMAAGLALRERKVFACFQSTFLQRAMDQLFHDVCYMKLPVTVIAARSGFAGFDSPTHHGIYDLSYLRCLPNLRIFYAGTRTDLERILGGRLHNPTGPLLVLHPYESVWEGGESIFPRDDDLQRPSTAFEGRDGFIFAVGNRLQTAVRLRERLADLGQDFGLLNVRWVSPFPEDLLPVMRRVPKVITLEENVREGGFGAQVAQAILQERISCDLFASAIDCGFVETGDKDALSAATGIDEHSVLDRVRARWGF